MSQDLKTIQATERLTDLPEGWVWTEFGDILEDVEKVNPKENPEVEFDYLDIASIDNKQQKVVSPKQYLGKDAPSRARQLVRSGDILFSTVRTYLKNIAMVGDIYDGQIASTGFCVIRPHGLVSNRFFFYLVLTDDFLNPLNQIQRGTSYPAVRNSDIYDQAVPLPPFPEQHRIVEKIEELFTKLDAGIASLKKVQAQLKRYRQSVLKAAVEGKLTEEWREKHKDELEPASVLLERILKERREKWEAEQLEMFNEKGKVPKDGKWKGKYTEPFDPEAIDSFEIPDCWAWATIQQLSTEVRYGTSKKTDSDPNGVPVLRMGNIMEGRLLFDNLKYLPRGHEEFPDLLLELGDLLFNRTNSWELVGKTAIYKGNPKPCSFASYLIRVRFNYQIHPDFFSFFINSVYGRQWISSVVSQQVGQANVNGTKLQALTVPLPPAEEQKAIVEEAERRLSVIEETEANIEAELRRAERLRQSVLKQAFSGKLVPQDPTDEPASVLLERIKAEKAKVEKENKSKKKSMKRSKEPEQMNLL